MKFWERCKKKVHTIYGIPSSLHSLQGKAGVVQRRLFEIQTQEQSRYVCDISFLHQP